MIYEAVVNGQVLWRVYWKQELAGTLPREGVDVPALPQGAHPQCTTKPDNLN